MKDEFHPSSLQLSSGQAFILSVSGQALVIPAILLMAFSWLTSFAAFYEAFGHYFVPCVITKYNNLKNVHLSIDFSDGL